MLPYHSIEEEYIAVTATQGRALEVEDTSKGKGEMQRVGIIFKTLTQCLG
jgi:hypothetical protein